MSVKQRTLKSEFSLNGKGLHTGKQVAAILSQLKRTLAIEYVEWIWRGLLKFQLWLNM